MSASGRIRALTDRWETTVATVMKTRAAALFAGPDRRRVQSLAESHEYKKTSGSSDTAHTYDTTAI